MMCTCAHCFNVNKHGNFNKDLHKLFG
jgi:hypothetical protein